MAKSPPSKKPVKNSAASSSPPPPVIPPATTAKTSPKQKAVTPKESEPVVTTVISLPEKTVASTPSAAKKKTVKITLSKPVAKSKKVPVVKENKTPPPASDSNPSKRRLLFITAECTPLAQTGGLGDAVAGLTKALVHRGHDVRIVMPLYQRIDRTRYNITFSRTCCVHFGRGEEIWVGIFEGKLDGVVPIWFIDYERYFGRPGIYDGDEDSYRFGVLSKAALQICKDTNWIPHVAHVHDWMTAIAAVFLKTWDRVLSPLSNTASVLTIHNIGYQGKFDPSVLSFYGFGGDYLTPDKFEDFQGINLLKAGIQYADVVTTVSPNYANEIKGPIGGMGMGMYLNDRGDRVSGILNGVDTSVWNPTTDPLPSRPLQQGQSRGQGGVQTRVAGKVRPDGRSEDSHLRGHLPLRSAKGLST